MLAALDGVTADAALAALQRLTPAIQALLMHELAPAPEPDPWELRG
ncbi:hypothetical protein [Isoptericola dokdonensis]|uniref:Uncharacterized protein n=1 Tax=Isoptericola dokdonensis DS-3 TaxID=1300344 RepID=A0A161ILN8_9MICO|nr:hypothetical protein [Isoptericola dokdonensis]ANC31450.1 hypothetical protein I598_1902 [Isoptericola dokdonensis DS-3]